MNLPPRELLEETHEFPGPYLFKVIGKADAGFEARVVAVVRSVLALEVDPPFQVRAAVGGRHISVTIEPTVQSPDQVLELYRQLGTLDGLVMMF